MQSDTDSSCFSLSLSLCISLVSFSFLIESRVNHDEICHTPGGKNNRCHSGRRTTASNLLFDINGGCDRDKRNTWARLSLPSFFLKLPQKYESNYDGEPKNPFVVNRGKLLWLLSVTETMHSLYVLPVTAPPYLYLLRFKRKRCF